MTIQTPGSVGATGINFRSIDIVPLANLLPAAADIKLAWTLGQTTSRNKMIELTMKQLRENHTMDI
ncbi:hypothetical protein ALGA_2066 [Labilibaculum antarcticum]|uniref:Uncharacterized protein n=1 Tax=Labilibaculum antarcticum TaxID=1717717 RepID=A0A1Y1CJ43_9BACT|nr:hypothetical protein ALGA_2066 [Labilibaculum antarcticum]